MSWATLFLEGFPKMIVIIFKNLEEILKRLLIGKTIFGKPENKDNPLNKIEIEKKHGSDDLIHFLKY